ncbi:MAG TPA: hypothetical protein VNI84_02240 [Pyrinomonadaceae bacterium]|nr:hypothetical protein [Pyrinomonadaceae bacterium]
MKKFLFLLLLPILFVPCAAQEKCGLTLKEAPVFFGLRLNMTPAEVKSVFGRSLKLKIRKQGSFFQNFITKPPPAFLPGVRALYLRFFDYKLYQIEIFYEAKNNKAGSERQTLAEFVRILSADKLLPAAFRENKNGGLELKCAEFSLVADNVLNPRAELTDEAARARFEESERRKKR